MSGAIAIVGVGPGDPELLTLRAATAVDASDFVLHPGPRDDAGYAFEVVSTRLRPHQQVRGMALAMHEDADSVGYDRVALSLVKIARSGCAGVFLTEGDPLLYGTGSYVLDHVRQLDPALRVDVVPGVSAVAAAAARLGWSLARREQVLTLCPASYHTSQIGAILDRGGPSCWLKVAGVLPRLADELRRRGRLQGAALVEKVGRPDERIFLDLDAAAGVPLSYFSLVLVR
jgi:precorrin-2/cobalt-factor-2 C20-methyltransferase